MIKVVIAKLKSKQEKFEELKKFLQEKVPEARKYSGCREAHACIDEEDKAVVLYEV